MIGQKKQRLQNVLMVNYWLFNGIKAVKKIQNIDIDKFIDIIIVKRVQNRKRRGYVLRNYIKILYCITLCYWSQYSLGFGRQEWMCDGMSYEWFKIFYVNQVPFLAIKLKCNKIYLFSLNKRHFHIRLLTSDSAAGEGTLDGLLLGIRL